MVPKANLFWLLVCLVVFVIEPDRALALPSVVSSQASQDDRPQVTDETGKAGSSSTAIDTTKQEKSGVDTTVAGAAGAATETSGMLSFFTQLPRKHPIIFWSGLLLLTAVLVWGLFVSGRDRSRGMKEPVEMGSHVLNHANPDRPRREEVSPLHLKVQELEVKQQRQQQQIEALEARLGSLQEQMAHSRSTAPPALSIQAKAPTPSSVPPPQVRTEDVVGEAFVRWCNQGTLLIRTPGKFEEQLTAQLPGSHIAVVYRDLDSPALPVEFRHNGASSPAEYWLVENANERWLLPAPVNPTTFRDLAPAFLGGPVSPSSLQRIKPASVQQRADTFVLSAPGHVA